MNLTSYKIAATIRARMGSRRLPGKIMKMICNKPLIQWQVERLKRSKFLNDIIISTTDHVSENPLINFCKNNNIKFSRGSENDVLSRIAKTIKEYNIDINIELTGDCPLPDVSIIDNFIDEFLSKDGEYDLLSNAIKTTYPPGMEVTIYKSETLIDCDNNLSQKDLLREHGCFNLTRFPNKYKALSKIAPKCHNFPNIHIEVDTEEDFDLVKKIITHFYKKNIEYFDLDSILKFLHDNDDLLKLNSKIFREWKEFRTK